MKFKHILACLGLVSCSTPAPPPPTIERIICRAAGAYRDWDFHKASEHVSIPERQRVNEAYGNYVNALSEADANRTVEALRKAEAAMLSYVELVNQLVVPAVP